MNNKNLIKAKEWFKIADNDFGFAKSSLEDGDEYYAQICFLFHQAIEKYLKGYLIAKGKIPQKTHDLAFLIEECKQLDLKFEKFELECKEINKYYIPSRYPVYWIEVKKENTKQAFEAVEKIIQFIKENILY
ncbi:MAG: HEPN domain-containing protein [Candidatus Kuenenbacteria bacterium]